MLHLINSHEPKGFCQQRLYYVETAEKVNDAKIYAAGLSLSEATDLALEQIKESGYTGDVSTRYGIETID